MVNSVMSTRLPDKVHSCEWLCCVRKVFSVTTLAYLTHLKIGEVYAKGKLLPQVNVLRHLYQTAGATHVVDLFLQDIQVVNTTCFVGSGHVIAPSS